MVWIPLLSSSFSHDFNNTLTKGITNDKVAVSLEIAWVISSIDARTSVIFRAISNWLAVSWGISFSAA